MATLKKSFAGVLALFVSGISSYGYGSNLDPVDYDKLFPQYAELCAGSQYQDIVSGKGGATGHAVLFLKGACRDRSEAFPKLKPCQDGPGVGISTNYGFNSVLWVATEGRDMFFQGNIKPGSPMTKTQIDEVLQEAERQSILQNVKLQNWIMEDLAPEKNKWNHRYSEVESKEHYVYRMSLGTDFGLALARSMYCVRIPMTSEMMMKAIDYLNGENDKAFNRKAGYERGYNWDVVKNNCMHTAYNALAAAGMWPKKKIEGTKFESFLSFIASPFKGGSIASPFDTMLRIAKAAMDPVLRHPELLLSSEPGPKWQLQQEGTMLVKYGIHTPPGSPDQMYFNPSGYYEHAKDQVRAYLHLEPKYKPVMESLFNDANLSVEDSLRMARTRNEEALRKLSRCNRVGGSRNR